MKDYIRIARLDHWIKNIFMFPGVVLAVLLTDIEFADISIVKLFIGFLSTCMIASANYVINEWLDAKFDQYHPIKKNRPVVSGSIQGKYVVIEYVLFLTGGIMLALTVNKNFLITEIWLLIMGIIYNVKPIRTKDIIYLDVISESVNNMIRLLLGWFIITIDVFPPSSMLLGYWMAGAFLMGTKRLAEFRMIDDHQKAGLYRKSFKYYTEKTLLGSSFFYAMSATFLIGVFLVKYRIEYLLAMPVMFLLFSYYIMITYNKDSAAQKPEKLYRDKTLLVIVGIMVIVFGLLTLIDIPMLHRLISTQLIPIN